jgi:hypothetical protein
MLELFQSLLRQSPTLVYAVHANSVGGAWKIGKLEAVYPQSLVCKWSGSRVKQ